jgi:hypothetical protein
MDEIQNLSNLECYTPSSEPFRIYLYLWLSFGTQSFSYATLNSDLYNRGCVFYEAGSEYLKFILFILSSGGTR